MVEAYGVPISALSILLKTLLLSLFNSGWSQERNFTTGQTRQTLVAHIDIHRQAYVALIEAAEHVSHQTPSERTHVSYLMNSIDSTDAEVLAGLAAIRQDDVGMRGDFESAAIFLSPCP